MMKIPKVVAEGVPLSEHKVRQKDEIEMRRGGPEAAVSAERWHKYNRPEGQQNQNGKVLESHLG